MEFNHISVLLNECIENLNIKPDGVYLDATLGGAGHSRKIVERLSEYGRLIGVDQDEAAIEKAKTVLQEFSDRIVLIKSNFSDAAYVLDKQGFSGLDGVLMDLGVSSFQLDEPSRGFSYMNDAPLDMRMDSQGLLSAYDVVNEYPVKRLTDIIGNYGEERWAKRIAEFIVTERKDAPIETTFQLVSVIKKAIPKSVRQTGHHPAKKTFQAIRIEVNKELEILEEAIESLVAKLKPGGRICVITFHSLEDRIVKNVFRKLESPCICPKEFPICVCGKESVLEVISRKPILPLESEIEINPRSRSAKLRVAQKK